MTMKDELSQMFDALESGTSGEPEPTDAPTTEQPVDNETKPPTTDEPASTDAPETKPPKTEPPATEAPKDDDELVRTKAENEELKRKIDELRSAPKTKPPKTQPPTTDAPIGEEDFLKGVDLDDLERNPTELNKVLNMIYKKAVEKARVEFKKGNETLLKEVPKLVTKDIDTQRTMKELTDNFYKSNEDLREFPKVVSVVFDELVVSNPGKSIGDVLSLVAPETRKRLGLKKPDKKPVQSKDKNDKDNPPPLHRAKGKRSQQQSQETSKTVSEIDEMNKSLNR